MLKRHSTVPKNHTDINGITHYKRFLNELLTISKNDLASNALQN